MKKTTPTTARMKRAGDIIYISNMDTLYAYTRLGVEVKAQLVDATLKLKVDEREEDDGSVFEMAPNGYVSIPFASPEAAREAFKQFYDALVENEDASCINYLDDDFGSAPSAPKVKRKGFWAKAFKAVVITTSVLFVAMLLLLLIPTGGSSTTPMGQQGMYGGTGTNANTISMNPSFSDSPGSVAPLASMLDGADDMQGAHASVPADKYEFRPNVTMPEVALPDFSCDF